MKRICLFVSIFITLLSVAITHAGNNYFQYRYGTGENHGYEHYLLYEYGGVKDWAIGSTIVLANDGFTLFNPAVFYRINNNFELGLKYEHTSFDTDMLGPAVRWRNQLGSFHLNLDVAHYFSLHDPGSKTDLWAQITTANPTGWYWAGEVWYYNVWQTEEKLHLRPLKFGYRFANGCSPFVMGEYETNEKAVKLFVGVEFLF